MSYLHSKQLFARLVGRRVCSVEGASGVEHVVSARRIVSASAGGENLAVGVVLSVPLIEPTSVPIVHLSTSTIPYTMLCYILSSIYPCFTFYFTPSIQFIHYAVTFESERYSSLRAFKPNTPLGSISK